MRAREHEVIHRDGKPAAVIPDIKEYEGLLERVEDLDDLRALREMRTRPLKFRKLDDYLGDRIRCGEAATRLAAGTRRRILGLEES